MTRLASPAHTHAFIVIAPCGCIRAASVDDGSTSSALLMSDGLRAGYRVQRVPCEDVRTRPWRCGAETCPFHAPKQGALL